MKILIVENETYLAQSIASRLEDFGFTCQITSVVDSIMEKVDFDVIILSANVAGSHCEHAIKQNKDSIIIMMVSYVNEDMTIKPLKAGAKDYILKPFMIDELIRKIRHYQQHKDFGNRIVFYENYFSFLEKGLDLPDIPNSQPPFIIRSCSQRRADIYAMKYAIENSIILEFKSLKKERWKNILKSTDKEKNTTYITGLEELKMGTITEFLSHIGDKNIILSFTSTDELKFKKIIDISDNTLVFPDFDEYIMPIKEYEKNMIKKFENRYPDTELAKKLGISRKNLWEKRKKYGISKRK